MRRPIFFLGCSLGVMACGPSVEVEEREAEAPSEIFGGSAPDSPEHGAVVSLHTRSGSSVYISPFCTGTLITPTVVLTAAHCLDVAKASKPTYQTRSASSLAVYVGNAPAADLAQHVYIVTEAVIYSGYNRLAIRNDLGLLRLAAPVVEPAAVPVAALPASLGFTPADVGGLLNFAGFGTTETGSSGVKLQVDGVLASLGCTINGCPNAGDAATQIAYLQDLNGPCFGDSGGPAFVYRDSVAYVGGITSYGDNDCTVYGVSTRADAFQSFIDGFIAAGNPPDCSANGVCNSACAAGADPDCPVASCGNATCNVGESCDGRNGTLACAIDCPGNLGGKPASRYCYVNGVCTGPGCP